MSKMHVLFLVEKMHVKTRNNMHVQECMSIKHVKMPSLIGRLSRHLHFCIFWPCMFALHVFCTRIFALHVFLYASAFWVTWTCSCKETHKYIQVQARYYLDLEGTAILEDKECVCCINRRNSFEWSSPYCRCRILQNYCM